MPLSHRRRLRFWLVTPLLLLGLLFAIDAAYGQPGRPPGFPRTQPVNPALPPGITPAGPLPGGLPANPPVNPGAPGLAPGGPGGPGAKPGLPLPPGWGNNPGLNPPNGIPGNPGGVEVVRTCTCSKCGATFPINATAAPTHCAKCGVKFDVVLGDTGTPSFPPAGGPPAVFPPPLMPPPNPGGFQGEPNVITPPEAGPAPFDPPSFNSNPPPFPSSSSGASPPSPGRAVATGFAIVAGIGIVLLGVLLIGGVVAFIVICRSLETSSAGRGRRGPRRRRNYDA